jgi:3-isopropylmalate/(R)-2-methylmalate dehydratase large subunit
MTMTSSSKTMTMTQKILADRAGLDHVAAGQLIQAKVDMVLGNDITAPVAIAEFHKAGFKQVFDPHKIALVMDHFTPCKDIKSAELCQICRDFSAAHDIRHFYDVGDMGVEHALLPEKGLVASGELVIGADSHTCTYGALGAFSTGVGSTDLAAAMATGQAWFKVPAALCFCLTGKPQPYVSGKDIILHIIGLIGVDGALYKSMEFVGSGLAHLTMDDRFTMANMAIEAGAKNGIFAVDDITKTYLKDRVQRPYRIYQADSDVVYDAVYEIDLSQIQPTVAFPHLPSNVRTPNEFGHIAIDQVVIGSCTNGRLQDLQIAAEILQGRKVAPGVRAIIIPATQKIYKDAMQLGYLETFIEAGCAVSTPTCGPCLGGHMGILAAGQRCVATTNRNFVGRMGHVESEVYLASPAVAAASAVAGYLTTPQEIMARHQGLSDSGSQNDRSQNNSSRNDSCKKGAQQ